MPDQRANIVLIGMPGAGKSTVGVLLAKQTSRSFIDTDLLIQNRHRSSLQEIIDTRGYLTLRRFEEEAIVSLRATNAVVATGGSAVYSKKSMDHLRLQGRLVYLKVGRSELLRRIDNYETRGLAKPVNQSFGALFRERSVLYRKYSDVTVDCTSKNHEDVVKEIVHSLKAASELSTLSDHHRIARS